MNDRTIALISITAMLLLSFVAGSVVTEFKIFPYTLFEKSYRGAKAYRHDAKIKKADFSIYEWHEAKVPSDYKGVTIHEKGKAYEGLTLFTSSHANKAFLIDMDGKNVHEWIFPSQTKMAISAKDTLLRSLHLYPDGDLLAIQYSPRFTFSADSTALIRMDKESRIIWTYNKEWAHHDLNVGEDGNIYLLTRKVHTELPSYPVHWNTPWVEDGFAVISPEGKELKTVSIIDALRNSPNYSEAFDFIADKERTHVAFSFAHKGDLTHANSITYVSARHAGIFPFLNEGDVVISLREIDAIIAINPDTEQVVWAMRGFWRVQHDADLLDNGHILLFDNEGNRSDGGSSRILEFDPITNEITWSYKGNKDHIFESLVRSSQQRLPNGNTMITEFDSGRIFEVTPQKEIVWEYLNPQRTGKKNEYIAGIHDAKRFSARDLKFIASEK